MAMQNNELLELTTALKYLHNLICQYNTQHDPEDKAEIQKWIKQSIEEIKAQFIRNQTAYSSKYKTLRAHFEELIKEFEQATNPAHDDDDFDEAALNIKEDVDMNVKVVSFDPEEELKEELAMLRGVIAIKKATVGLVDKANVNLAEQEDIVNGIEANSEVTVVRTEQAVNELKKTAQESRGSGLTIVKWASAAIGWVVAGPVGGIVTGLGLHAAQKGVSSIHDEKLEKVANA